MAQRSRPRILAKCHGRSRGAAVNDQCAWYLGDHAFLAGQSDSGLLSSARRRSTCSAWIAGQLPLHDVLRQLGWRASVRNYAQGQAAHRVRERCADNQPSAASPGDSGDYASAGINGRTRRSASTCASTDWVTTAGKPTISRVIVTRGRLQIMRRRKTVLTNRAVRVGNAIRGHYSGPPGYPSVGAGVKAAG
jgi:hypothetical protein